MGWPQAKRRRRVVDSFTYNGPPHLLEARLLELAPVANLTAVLTTELNFRGLAHEPPEVPPRAGLLHTLLSARAFDECRGQDGEVIAWCAASLAKNSVAAVVERAGLEDEDWVLFSDADEIPDREAVRLLHECELPVVAGNVSAGDELLFVRFHTRAHYLYSTRCQAARSTWTHYIRGPLAVKGKTMRTFGLVHWHFQGNDDCHVVGPYASCWRGPLWRTENLLLLDCSAWHLSHFGGGAPARRTTSDNADPARLADRWLVRRCREDNPVRDEPYVLLPEPMLRYPHVPHSVAELPGAFAAFPSFE